MNYATLNDQSPEQSVSNFLFPEATFKVKENLNHMNSRTLMIALTTAAVFIYILFFQYVLFPLGFLLVLAYGAYMFFLNHNATIKVSCGPRGMAFNTPGSDNNYGVNGSLIPWENLSAYVLNSDGNLLGKVKVHYLEIHFTNRPSVSFRFDDYMGLYTYLSKYLPQKNGSKIGE